jgi:lysyl-tRNA synthetase class 1
MSESESTPTLQDASALPEAYLCHWADQAAARTIAAHPNASTFAVAAGITPSGVVHIGNFREVMTVDLVARALRDRGKNVRFIYSWDDFDVFRKVPKDMPQQEALNAQLRRSIVDVIDPYGTEDSYAAHHIAAFEKSLQPIGIAPEFIRQSQRYRAGAYAQGIKRALDKKDVIRTILDAHRAEPLEADWLPLAGFCDACGKDELKFEWLGDYSVRRQCLLCNHDSTTDLREGGNIKLPWRIDWPMRWAYEGVCFEPGGKDHSSAGGSFDTGKEIVAQVYEWTAPQYVAYDFVRIKGQGGKISSSAGGALTVEDVLEVYEPEVLRWIFASYRPNTEFQISFDVDVIKIYEDHDRMVGLASRLDDGSKSDEKRVAARRILHLASPTHQAIVPGEKVPFLAGFRALSITIQIYDGDIERALAYHESTGEITTEEERRRFRQRAQCVWNWLKKYAPEEYHYKLRTEPAVRALDDEPKLILGRLVAALEAMLVDSSLPFPDVRSLCEGTSLDVATFSPTFYDLVLDRPKGPRIANLVAQMGVARAIDLLKPSC